MKRKTVVLELPAEALVQAGDMLLLEPDTDRILVEVFAVDRPKNIYYTHVVREKSPSP